MDELLDLSQMSGGGPTAVTIGVFDGVHVGHQHLVSRLKQLAAERSLSPVVIVVHPPPQTVLEGLECWSFLTHLAYRRKLLKRCGVDKIITLEFTSQVSLISAFDFCGELVDKLQMRLMVAGPDFALGHRREGNMSRLDEIGRSLGFDVQLMDYFSLPDRPVSSSGIRAALEIGHIREANAMSGRRFEIDGVVVEGEKRGRLIGFPTANILPKKRQLVPRDGVYAVMARCNGQSYGGVANLGVRPTFGGGVRILEVHLFEFTGDIYGDRLEVAFVDSMRGERQFAGIDELRSQIAADVKTAQRILTQQAIG